MMKKSRFLSLALTGALCLSLLAGCGSSGGGGAASTPAPNGGGDVSTPAPAPAGDAFKIGGVGPLTGGAAIYGNAAANGARIAADEINALGGIQIDLRRGEVRQRLQHPEGLGDADFPGLRHLYPRRGHVL